MTDTTKPSSNGTDQKAIDDMTAIEYQEYLGRKYGIEIPEEDGMHYAMAVQQIQTATSREEYRIWRGKELEMMTQQFLRSPCHNNMATMKLVCKAYADAFIHEKAFPEVVQEKPEPKKVGSHLN